MDLHEKKCVPCEGGTEPMQEDEIEKHLKELNDWQATDTTISKQFSFSDFKEAVAFVNNVADIAEDDGHHPDIYVHDYKKVDITLSTHAIGGLSENDFIVAAKIDRI